MLRNFVDSLYYIYWIHDSDVDIKIGTIDLINGHSLQIRVQKLLERIVHKNDAKVKVYSSLAKWLRFRNKQTSITNNMNTTAQLYFYC